MYSRPIIKPTTFTLYAIKKNNIPINYNQFTNLEESILLSQIKEFEITNSCFPNYTHKEVLANRFKQRVTTNTFNFIKDGLINDSTYKIKFPIWFNHQFIHTKDSYSITQNEYKFDDKQCISSKTIINSNE